MTPRSIKLTDLRNAFAVHDVELDLLEGRRHLVLDDLDARLVADQLLALLDLADAANVEADGGVEFQRVAARRRLRIAEHDADLHADLVDEDHHRASDLEIDPVSLRSAWLIRRACRPGRLSPISPSSSALGRQRRDRVDDEHVDRAGAHQRIGDLERLLAGVGLRDQQVLDLDAELLGIGRIERMLGVDEARKFRPSSGPRRSPATRASSCPRIPARRSR